jgi:hypothetical protein
VLRPVHATGELKNAERCVTTAELLEEAKAAQVAAARRGK